MVRRASALSAADGAIRAALGFAASIFLARLLAPSDFGLVALAIAFTTFAGVLIDFGLSSALIRMPEASSRDESTVFYFTVGLSVIVATVLTFSAPHAAKFFGRPDLAGIIRLMSAGLVIAALGAIHTTLMVKRMDLARPLVVGAVSTGLSGAIAIALAMRGLGAWSLAWQWVAQATISTILLWVLHHWRPVGFSANSLRRLAEFGRPLATSGLIDVAYNQSYSIFIGKQLSIADLGLYNRAQMMQQLPSGLLANVIHRVALPTYSQYVSQPRRLAAAFSQSLWLVMFVNLPLMAGLAIVAQPLIEVLLGPRWLPAAPLLQIMCIIGAVWPMNVLNLTVLLAEGHSRVYLRLEIAKKAIGVGILVATIGYGVVAVVWGQAMAAVIAFFINSAYSGQALGFGPLAQLRVLIPEVAATAVMAVLVTLLNAAIALPPASRLICLVVVGIGIYAGTIAVVSPSRLGELVRHIMAVTSENDSAASEK